MTTAFVSAISTELDKRSQLFLWRARFARPAKDDIREVTLSERRQQEANTLCDSFSPIAAYITIECDTGYTVERRSS